MVITGCNMVDCLLYAQFLTSKVVITLISRLLLILGHFSKRFLDLLTQSLFFSKNLPLVTTVVSSLRSHLILGFLWNWAPPSVQKLNHMNYAYFPLP